MSIKTFIFLMTLGTGAAWAAWLTVLFRIDPFSDGGLGFLLFYASLWLAMTGSITLVGLAIRAFFDPGEALFRHVSKSFRQAVFLSFLVVALLFFQSRRLLTWWNALLLVFGCLLLEIFAVAYFTRRRRV